MNFVIVQIDNINNYIDDLNTNIPKQGRIMSRWTEQYDAHAFHAEWDKLISKIDELNNMEIVDTDALAEVARLSKLTVYVDSLLKIIDPEVNSNLNAILNAMSNEAINVVSQVGSYMDNKNIAHLHQANKHIEECLNYIKQLHIVLPKVTGQGISSMLKKYNKTIEDALKQIKLTETLKDAEEIKALKNRLIDDEDSIQNTINIMTTDAEEKHEKLEEYYNLTLNDKEYDNTTKERIEKTEADVEEVKTEIKKHLKEAKEELLELSKKIEEYEKYYVNVFGELNEEDEVRKGGLKEEIEKRMQALISFDEKQQKVFVDTLKQKVKGLEGYEKAQKERHNSLFNQIESLLPGATSAGLAKAYYDERDKFKKPIKYWNGIFIASLAGISLVSAFSLKSPDSLIELGKNIAHSLPLTGPLIWLAIYANKRRSESQRLEQEYAHKETLANSYSGYKQQIENLNKEDQALLVKLLDSAIEAASYNASLTLDGKHGDSTPIEEVLTKANKIKTQIANLKD